MRHTVYQWTETKSSKHEKMNLIFLFATLQVLFWTLLNLIFEVEQISYFSVAVFPKGITVAIDI
jgi:hypothetical protein